MGEEKLLRLANPFFGNNNIKLEKLAGAGSNRVYYRIKDNVSERTIVGVVGTDEKENRAFIYFSEVFRRNGLCVPEVYAVSDDGLVYLQEDLGDIQLFGLLNNPSAFCGYVSESMKALSSLQFAKGLDYSKCYPVSEFDRRQVMWDLNYFKYCFLKPVGNSFDEKALEDDFERFAEKLLSFPKTMWGFMYRDCQSRNVMIHKDKPYWIDFQSGRYGPCIYDIVSFLWQAKACFENDFREQMIDIYLESCRQKGVAIDEKLFREMLPSYVLFRTLQVLGAYGFRGLIEHKSHFVESIPFALKNLKALLESQVCEEFPELGRVLMDLSELKRFLGLDRIKGLRVEVFSFSYKKGYPEDLSGNGGGFMFDCRAMHNPGRYAEYKLLTGLDDAVKLFLEDQGEVQLFLDSAWQMTDSAVERYLKRGFTNLQIGFGCTGGQHRSVYCAEATARHIADKFPNAQVKLVHREQNIERFFEKGVEE